MGLDEIRRGKELAEEKRDAKKTKRKKGELSPLQIWYQRIMDREDTICWEDPRIWINKLDTRWWHGSVAHILPKKIFDSVKTHPLNYMILDMYSAHKRYDSNWYNASRMKVWPRAVQRFIIMYPQIAEEEKKYIPEILWEELKKVGICR